MNLPDPKTRNSGHALRESFAPEIRGGHPRSAAQIENPSFVQELWPAPDPQQRALAE